MIYLDNAATTLPQAGGRLRRDGPLRPALARQPGRSGHKMAGSNPNTHSKTPATASTASSTAATRTAGRSRSTAPTPSTWRSRACSTTATTSSPPTSNTTASRGRSSRSWRPKRITITRVPADGGGTIDPEAIRAAIDPKTRLIADDARQQRPRHRAAGHARSGGSPANTTCCSSWTPRKAPA